MLTGFGAKALIPALSRGALLRRTVRRPDLLAALAQSAGEWPLDSLPRNASEIYTLYLHYIFATIVGSYDYQRIKRPILAELAWTMLRSNRPALACDDALYEQMASTLQKLYQRYHRRRRVMPYDWSAEELHDELLHSPVMDLAAGRGEMLTFSKALYRDYFVAAYVASSGAASDDAREFATGLQDGQLEALSFLFGMDPEATALVDYVPHKLLPAAAQIWLEERAAGASTPGALQQAYREEREAICSNLFGFADTAADAVLMRRWATPTRVNGSQP